MTRHVFFLILLLNVGHTAVAQFNYPATKTVDSSDTWHNVTVKDPYRWLEYMKSPEVISWFKSQANFTDSILNKLSYAEILFNEQKKLDVVMPEEKSDARRIGKSVVYSQTKQGEDKMKIFRLFDNEGLPQVIASPQMWGEHYQIQNFEFDPSEKYIAIYAHESGKEINEVKIYSIAENKILPDKITGSYKGFVNNQNGVFYYVQFPTYDPKEIYLHLNDVVFKTHVIGADTSMDKVIVSKQSSPELMSYTDGRFLWEIQTFKGCKYEFACVYQTSFAEIWYRESGTVKWKKIFGMSDMISNWYYFNNKLYYVCSKDAPNGKIKMVDLSNLFSTHKDILPEQADPLDYNLIAKTKNYLIVPFKKNGTTSYTKFIYLPTNKVTASPFKENTSSTKYFALCGNKNDSIFIQREGWTNYPQITEAVIGSTREKPYKYISFNATLPFASNLMVEEVEAPSYDGTLVPLTIIRRKDLKLNGNNVAIVQGYGAYGDPVRSFYFHRNYAILANKGVVCCFAHVRGGGEKGNNWHLGGMKQSKPNSWKDFNACAEYLVSKGYTSTTHLACEAASAGGILIGRAITERPDLWACATPESAVLNVLRSEFSGHGKSQNEEYGAIDNINEFFSLMESDAILHIQKGIKYPAILVTTSWEDSRVSSWMSAKFVAAAQNATASDKPVLLNVDFNGGHFGNMTDKQTLMKKMAEKYAFILWQCGFDKTNKYD